MLQEEKIYINFPIYDADLALSSPGCTLAGVINRVLLTLIFSYVANNVLVSHLWDKAILLLWGHTVCIHQNQKKRKSFFYI